MVTMAAIAYVAPESVAKVLDVVTLNIGANNNDFEWLKTTLLSYLNGEIKLDEVVDKSVGLIFLGFLIFLFSSISKHLLISFSLLLQQIFHPLVNNFT